MRQLLSVLAICGLVAIMAGPSFGAWTVVDLGTLNPDGTGSSTGRGISDDGAYVVGWASSPSHATETPFRFNDANGNLQVDPGEMINVLDVLNASTDPVGTYTRGQAGAVNSSGVVVGRTIDANDGFRMTDPPYMGDAPDGITNIIGINDAGLAVASGGSPSNAFLLELDDTWTALPSTSDWSEAADINDNNMICGKDDGNTSVRQGIVWEHDGSGWVKTILPEIAGNGEGEAWGLNDNGQVVGRMKISGSKYAVLWENDGSDWAIRRLDNSATQTQAHDINNAGVVVGSDTGISTGYMWTPDGSGGYTRSNIEDLVAGSGWTIREGTGISDQGWIIGTGMAPGGSEWHAVLITDAEAVPEPSLAIMILGLILGLTAIRRR